MKFASGVSDFHDASSALENACRQVREQLGELSCDAAFVFTSAAYEAAWEDLLDAVHRRLSPRVLIGCSGSGIIGAGRELERVPAISVVGANLPGVKLFPFSATPDELENSSPGGFWIDKVGAAPQTHPIFVVFADPLTCQPSKLVDELSATYQGSPIIGGLLSGGDQPGEHTLFAGLSVLEEGAVGLAMTGNIEVNTIISQGCRPIGRPVVVTQVQDNLLITLGGQPALAFLHEVLRALPRQDQDLAQHGAVLIGLVINEMRSKFSSGDFLIRSILGIEPELGALAISDRVFVGQTVQFQLHDPATARQQLRQLLQQVGHSLEAPPAGGLLFNCTGRGRSLYGMSHQDVKTIQLVSGKMPIGGFFCNGEIGPVGGINLLHGYTASLGLFRPSTSGLGKP